MSWPRTVRNPLFFFVSPFRQTHLFLTVLCVFFAVVFAHGSAWAKTRLSTTRAAMLTYGLWDVESKERLDVAVWFPTSVEGRGVKIEGWHVAAQRSSKIIPGFYPIVLLSHDTASGRFANNDLAIALAGKGFIVIAPTHLGDNQNNCGKLYTADLFHSRPRQLLLALETVLGSPELAPYADESRIAVLGVGAGAMTALQLAGATPDLQGLESLCAITQNEDSLCSPWVRKKLGQAHNDMQARIAKEGERAFTPRLDLLAPMLAAAEVPAQPHAKAVQPEPPKKERALSFLQRYFAKDAPEHEESAVTEEGTEADASALEALMAEDYFIRADFQLVSTFGAVSDSQTLLITPGPVVANFGVTVLAEESSQFSSIVGDAKKTRRASPVFRRPAAKRKIQALVLVAPAGGMFFSKASLAGVKMPVAIIEAEKNDLYPSIFHTKPFFTALPSPPEVLRLQGADHFSLFAPCSQEMLASLGEICGRAVGAAREDLQQNRNNFLGAFLVATLGEVHEVPPPSGLAAVPASPDTKQAGRNATKVQDDDPAKRQPERERFGSGARRRTTRAR